MVEEADGLERLTKGNGHGIGGGVWGNPGGGGGFVSWGLPSRIWPPGGGSYQRVDSAPRQPAPGGRDGCEHSEGHRDEHVPVCAILRDTRG